MALESGYDAVSIRNLTQRADIGYATFYRHFKSKDDLLTHVLMSRLKDMQRSMAQADSPRGEAELMFRYVRLFPQEYRLYVSLPASNRARPVIRAEIERMLMARYKPKAGATVPLEVAINHIIQSAHELLSWYLENLNAYTPQEVTAIYADLISRETTAVSLERRPDWPPRPDE